MLIKKPGDVLPSEITPPTLFKERRRFIQAAAATAAVALLPGILSPSAAQAEDAGAKLDNIKPSPLSTDEKRTPLAEVTSYNNFYEFGTDKTDPARNAHTLHTKPWTVTVEGHCEKPGRYNLEDLLAPHALEERVYRLRCVEAWSMVVPWVGIPLGEVIKRLQPTSNANYVEFVTLLNPEQMPGQRRAVLDWPYREGLRMDEAMHPLTILAVGLYGQVLPNQNGAPLRLVVPWKYGFKSIKSIVALRFVEEPPRTSWAVQNPGEYGFYANVNPVVDHPRWSQKKERRIGELFRRDTLPFNGYGEQVAGLYTGMDLRQLF